MDHKQIVIFHTPPRSENPACKNHLKNIPLYTPVQISHGYHPSLGFSLDVVHAEETPFQIEDPKPRCPVYISICTNWDHYDHMDMLDALGIPLDLGQRKKIRLGPQSY